LPHYRYAQLVGGDEAWQVVKDEHLRAFLKEKDPMFVTVLSVSQMIEKNTEKEALAKVLYRGPLYFDWDAADIADAIPQAIKLLQNLEDKGVELSNCHLYATGGKGFHAEIPETAFMEKADLKSDGTAFLPAIYKEMAFELAVDTLDFKVYSARKGRMWRQPNVKRPNGKYKVPISWKELKEMTPEAYLKYTSLPRSLPVTSAPSYSMGLGLVFDRCKQKIVQALARKKKSKRATKLRAGMPSLQALCEGRGLKPGAGFNDICLQLAIIAHDLRWSEEDLIKNCQGLIANHTSDSGRYDSEHKRIQALRAIFSYTEDNPQYEVSIGAIKTLLTHSAPDLEGLPVSTEEIEVLIENPDLEEGEDTSDDNDENSVVLNKFGIYVPGEFGLRRISALGFEKTSVLVAMLDGTILGIETDVMANGKKVGRASIGINELNNTNGLNKLASRYGHAFQGTENQARGTYMRIIGNGKKFGGISYVTNKEGLDIVSIPSHEKEELHTPFLIWADSSRVIVEPRIATLGVHMRFQGYPDARGQFRTDLSNAPGLKEWLEIEGNKEVMFKAVRGLLAQQKMEYTAKVWGWMIACFYRALFQKAYSKFPLLHINGPAGAGKTSGIMAMSQLFYYTSDPPLWSPSSTTFALSYNASSSSSLPMVIDEYKPHAMREGMHDALKAVFREAYNGKTISKGGGNQLNEDFRALHETTLSAPICFIAEAMEEESAVMERVVLATLSPASSSMLMLQLQAFEDLMLNRHTLGVLGAYIAAEIVNRYSVQTLIAEFEPILEEARKEFLYNKPTEDEVERIRARERSVFNYAVAEFGMMKFSKLMDSIFGENTFEQLNGYREKVYMRLVDLNVSTEPEWLKVFNVFSEMSHSDLATPWFLKNKIEYVNINYGGKSCLEIHARALYMKYRLYCRSSHIKPLYAGEAAFIHGLKDCPALVIANKSVELQAPGGSHIFDAGELSRAGFRGLK
jgi:hypothetical protein